MKLTVPEKTSALILVIDNDPAIRQVMRQILTNEGYQVAEGSNGAEGLELYMRLHPDLVLLDAMMPVMDGFTCCAKLQSMSGGQHTPVLFITTLGDESSVERAFAAGATDYMTKPIHWAVLSHRIRRLLHQAQLSRELEGINQVLQRLVTIDSLTQVANRRRFDEYLEQTWEKMLREWQYLSLVLCDIDFFKSYNDTLGHQAGDLCLQRVAEVLKSVVRRPADLVARYGGEEFAVILPHTPLEGARKLAEAIHAEVRALQIPHSRSAISKCVTLSLGVGSTLPTAAMTPAELVAVADQALYQAKAHGRDRIVMGRLSEAGVVMADSRDI